jgi:hypothetical protein
MTVGSARSVILSTVTQSVPGASLARPAVRGDGTGDRQLEMEVGEGVPDTAVSTFQLAGTGACFSASATTSLPSRHGLDGTFVHAATSP